MQIGIVGAGIFGVAASLELRSRGHDVTVVERGRVPHPEASSTDVSKAIRRTNYPEETYVELVAQSARQWRAWHERLSQAIYYQTGMIIILRDMGQDSAAVRGWETLKRVSGREGGEDGAFELTVEEAAARFPQISIRDGDTVLFDPWSGYVRSAQAVSDLAGLASDDGVLIRENAAVREVTESADDTRLVCDDETLTFDRVIVAAGPWVTSLLPGLLPHIRTTRQQMAFFAPRDSARFDRRIFPMWSAISPTGAWYGFPFLQEGFVKVAEDDKIDEVAPDTERTATGEFLDAARRFVADRIPELAEAELVGGRSCIYTNTPDNHFIIDWAPGFERVLVAGCGCGHGFKFGGSIGPVIADALEERVNPLGELFRIGTRFCGAASGAD